MRHNVRVEALRFYCFFIDKVSTQVYGLGFLQLLVHIVYSLRTRFHICISIIHYGICIVFRKQIVSVEIRLFRHMTSLRRAIIIGPFISSTISETHNLKRVDNASLIAHWTSFNSLNPRGKIG